MISNQKKQMRKIIQDIRCILLHDWDPIGIENAGPNDEYDDYIWEIVQMLEAGTTVQALTEYLLSVDPLCMEPESQDLKRNHAVAKKLMTLKILQLK